MSDPSTTTVGNHSLWSNVMLIVFVVALLVLGINKMNAIQAQEKAFASGARAAQASVVEAVVGQVSDPGLRVAAEVISDNAQACWSKKRPLAMIRAKRADLDIQGYSAAGEALYRQCYDRELRAQVALSNEQAASQLLRALAKVLPPSS